MAQAPIPLAAAAAQKDDSPAKWRRRSLVRVRRPAWAQAASPAQRPVNR
jgi:hypothetical protein